MIAGLGEDRLLAELLARLPSGSGRGVVAGAGRDDCAIVRRGGRKFWQLLKTDCVIAGVHFTPDTTPEAIGWKALCRPLSDIAATGGKPQFALVTFALPGDAPLNFATGIYTGLGKAAEEFKVEIVGGELARTPGPASVTVFVTGTVKPKHAVTRGGGEPGDILYVTGCLGGSLASGRHLTFRPRIREARWLVTHYKIHAMMDLSDGLAADLPRLARSSGTGFSVDPDRVPLAEGCTVTQALGDGEDYELLFAVAPKQAAKLAHAWRRRWRDVPLTAVGTLQDATVATGLSSAVGFDHFEAATGTASTAPAPSAPAPARASDR